MNKKERIFKIISDNINCKALDVKDNSHLHKGHVAVNGATETHYEVVIKANEFDYAGHVRELKRFDGSHPKVMKERVNEKNWNFDYDISRKSRSIKDKTKSFLKKYLGIDTSHKNYEIIKLAK